MRFIPRGSPVASRLAVKLETEPGSKQQGGQPDCKQEWVYFVNIWLPPKPKKCHQKDADHDGLKYSPLFILRPSAQRYILLGCRTLLTVGDVVGSDRSTASNSARLHETRCQRSSR